MGFEKYGPKGPLSPTLGDLCPICGEELKVGDFTTLVRTTRTSKHGNRRIEAHWDCATRAPD